MQLIWLLYHVKRGLGFTFSDLTSLASTSSVLLSLFLFVCPFTLLFGSLFFFPPNHPCEVRPEILDITRIPDGLRSILPNLEYAFLFVDYSFISNNNVINVCLYI